MLLQLTITTVRERVCGLAARSRRLVTPIQMWLLPCYASRILGQLMSIGDGLYSRQSEDCVFRITGISWK